MTEEKEKDLDRIFRFLLEIDKAKSVFRQTPVSDASRKENDAEHSWHLAIMALLLGDYANEKVNVSRVMEMVLIHDLVEIYAGDTYAYDEIGKTTQREREVNAADRLYALLPEKHRERLRSLWDEFEEEATPEAKFAHALDHVQPTMLNHATNGVSWKEHGVCMSQVLDRNRKTPEGSAELWEYARKHFIEPHADVFRRDSESG